MKQDNKLVGLKEAGIKAHSEFTARKLKSSEPHQSGSHSIRSVMIWGPLKVDNSRAIMNTTSMQDSKKFPWGSSAIREAKSFIIHNVGAKGNCHITIVEDCELLSQCPLVVIKEAIGEA